MAADRHQPLLIFFVRRRAEISFSPEEPDESAEIQQLSRQGTDQGGVVDFKVFELRKCFQFREVTEFARDGAGQAVVPQTQGFQLREVAEFGWDRAGQTFEFPLVVAQIQGPKLREAAEFARDRAGQVVARQT